LSVLDKPTTDISFVKYSHIVEGGLNVDSGIINFLECPTSAVTFTVKVKPDKYRIRVYMMNLVDTDEDESTDYYKIEMWPSSDKERVVLKRHPRITPKY